MRIPKKKKEKKTEGSISVMRFFASLVLAHLGKIPQDLYSNCTGEENTRARASRTARQRNDRTHVSSERGARATWSSPIIATAACLLALFVFSPPITPTELAKSSHTRRTCHPTSECQIIAHAHRHRIPRPTRTSYLNSTPTRHTILLYTKDEHSHSLVA
jgi:hypothetical protein